MTEGEPAELPAEREEAAAMTAHALEAPRVRARRPGVGTVYRWELRKLVAQKRTYLGLIVAIAIPVIFVVALAADSSGGPDEVPFGSYVRETGWPSRSCAWPSARSG